MEYAKSNALLVAVLIFPGVDMDSPNLCGTIPASAKAFTNSVPAGLCPVAHITMLAGANWSNPFLQMYLTPVSVTS